MVAILKYCDFMGQEGLVDGAAGLLVHEGHVEPLGNGGCFDGTADGSVPSHGTIDVALGHGFGRDVVADDGQRALLAQHAIGIFVRALDYIFKAAGDPEFDQFGENGAHDVVVAVGVEVVMHLEIGRGPASCMASVWAMTSCISST